MNALNPGHPIATPTPTANDVQRISVMDDPVLRNWLITQCYHDLSRVLAQWLPQGANWCTLATWALRQAVPSLRTMRMRLRMVLHFSPTITVVCTR